MNPSVQYLMANSDTDWITSLNFVKSPASFSGRFLLALSFKVVDGDRHLTDRLSTHYRVKIIVYLHDFIFQQEVFLRGLHSLLTHVDKLMLNLLNWVDRNVNSTNELNNRWISDSSIVILGFVADLMEFLAELD